MPVHHTRILDLPKISGPVGNLTFIENNRHIPFEIKRLFYIYDVPSDASRAGHAHKTLHQILIAMSGSFDVTVDNGQDITKLHLNHLSTGLYIPPMIWLKMDNFSPGSICLTLASDFYDQTDYFRDYSEFLRAIKAETKD